MKLELTRRILLKLAGASSLGVAAVAAARAEGGRTGGGRVGSLAHRAPIRIGAAALRVRNLALVTDYYRDALGLTVLARDESTAHLGVSGIRLLTMERWPDAPFERTESAGLFHTAFLMPTRKDLARWLVYAARNRLPLTGFADHLVSEAVYLDDPEGNGIEVYSDRDPQSWSWTGGAVAMATKQLNIEDLVSLTDVRTSNYAVAPDGMRIGHMHLKVGEISRAESFYRSAVGFDLTRQRTGASFLSSGRYHHHLGLNIWRSEGTGQRDDKTTGLAWFSLEVDDFDILAGQEQRLKEAGAALQTIPGGIETIDPWGTRLRIVRI